MAEQNQEDSSSTEGSFINDFNRFIENSRFTELSTFLLDISFIDRSYITYKLRDTDISGLHYQFIEYNDYFDTQMTTSIVHMLYNYSLLSKCSPNTLSTIDKIMQYVLSDTRKEPSWQYALEFYLEHEHLFIHIDFIEIRKRHENISSLQAQPVNKAMLLLFERIKTPCLKKKAALLTDIFEILKEHKKHDITLQYAVLRLLDTSYKKEQIIQRILAEKEEAHISSEINRLMNSE